MAGRIHDRLNLGSYKFPIEGYHNVDILDWPGVNEVVDLNKLPWPWKDGTFEHVRAVDIVEHLGKLSKVEIVRELARVTKIGGTVEIRVPCLFHPTSFQSLQHAHGFYLDSFASDYTNPDFICLERRVAFKYREREYRFVFPLRLIYRLCARLGLIETLTFILRREGECPECQHINGYHAMECRNQMQTKVKHFKPR